MTLGRRDDPPGFRVFREATMNLLIHQDYGDHSRKAVIKFFRDGIQFWNPRDVFGDDSRLFEPDEKEVRNPAITMDMRRIAICEQAGTGIRMMREEWQKLAIRFPPTTMTGHGRRSSSLSRNWIRKWILHSTKQKKCNPVNEGCPWVVSFLIIKPGFVSVRRYLNYAPLSKKV